MTKRQKKFLGILVSFAAIGFLSRGTICYTDLCGHEHTFQAKTDSGHGHCHHTSDESKPESSSSVTECCSIPAEHKGDVEPLSVSFHAIALVWSEVFTEFNLPVHQDLTLFIKGRGEPPPPAAREILLRKETLLL